MRIKINAGYFFVIALLCFETGYDLLSEGMFMDGAIYATIARNLAIGKGSFWYLSFSDTLFSVFHEHPPLAMGLQSVFFYLFGDHILVERLYSLGCHVIIGIIVVLIWKKTCPEELRRYGWVPLLLWCLIPNVFWAVSNNVLENTMIIFTTLSLYLMILSYHKHRFAYLALAGISISLGFLSKGLVAFFPLSFPFWSYFIVKRQTAARTSVDLAYLIGVIIVFFGLLFTLVPESYDSLMIYMKDQVFRSVSNRMTVEPHTRFYIVWAVLKELFVGTFVCLIIYLITRKSRLKSFSNKWAQRFLLVALSGVLPIMISRTQASFYVLPAYPVFILAYSHFIAPRFKYLIKKIDNRSIIVTVKVISIALSVLGLVYVLYFNGKITREKEIIPDVKKIVENIGREQTICGQKSFESNQSLIWSLARYGRISLATDRLDICGFYLSDSNDWLDRDENFTELDLQLDQFRLYESKQMR